MAAKNAVVIFLLNIVIICFSFPRTYIVLDSILLTVHHDYIINETIAPQKLGTPEVSFNLSYVQIKQLPEDTIIQVILLNPDQGNATIGRPIQHSYCDYIKNDRLLYPSIQKYGNFPIKCPVELKRYYLKNYKVPVDSFPPFLPVAPFLVVFKIFGDSMTVLEVNVEGRIVDHV